MVQVAKQTIEAGAVPLVSDTYRRGALVILFLTYALNYLDRQIITILAEPIKNELHISDTQLGMLTGLAFGLVYCGFGLPIARLADRFNRVWIIGTSLAVWSACTVLCGRAVNYATLVAARVGVGIGEAGCAPVGMALISDYTPKEKRASALAFFAMGTPIGSLLGLGLGGIIADAYGWRTAFLAAGLPGLVLALVVFLVLKEPRDALARETVAHEAANRPSLSAVFKYLGGKRTFWLMSFGAGVKAFIGYGQAPFVAAFFLRVHGPEIAELGASFGLKQVGVVGVGLGLIAGVFGALSNWLGGVIADHYGARDLRVYGVVPALAALVPIPFFISAMLADSAVTAMLLLIPGYLFGGLWFGPVLSSTQGLVPRQMRATAGSIALFILNMIGIGFGALVVGTLSDTFNHGFGLGPAEGVRWALIVSATFALIPALLFWLARLRIRDEMVS